MFRIYETDFQGPWLRSEEETTPTQLLMPIVQGKGYTRKGEPLASLYSEVLSAILTTDLYYHLGVEER